MKNKKYSILLEGERVLEGSNIDIKLDGFETQEDFIYSLEALLVNFVDTIDENIIGPVFLMLTDIYCLDESEALSSIIDYAKKSRFSCEYENSKIACMPDQINSFNKMFFIDDYELKTVNHK